METKQLNIRIDTKLHKKYLIHAYAKKDMTFTEWILTAMDNQYKLDHNKNEKAK